MYAYGFASTVFSSATPSPLSYFLQQIRLSLPFSLRPCPPVPLGFRFPACVRHASSSSFSALAPCSGATPFSRFTCPTFVLGRLLLVRAELSCFLFIHQFRAWPSVFPFTRFLSPHGTSSLCAVAPRAASNGTFRGWNLIFVCYSLIASWKLARQKGSSLRMGKGAGA